MGGAAAAAVVCAALLCYVLWPATSGDPAWLWTHRGGSGSGGGGGSPGRPGLVVPSPRSFGNGTIFDFVLTGDVQRDDNVTVYFAGVSLLRWHWTTFFCSFQVPGRRQRTAVSAGMYAKIFSSGRKGLQQVQCPLPAVLLEAVRRRKPRDLRFSVYEDADFRNAILEDIVVPLPVEPQRQFRVVVQTMLKDEADAVVEWIEYHRLLGVEHFYIYDNNSRDGLRRRLQRYRCAGLVTLIEWPFLPIIQTPADDKDWPWPLVQQASWNHFVQAYGRHTQWVSFADVDEYFQLNETYADALDSGAMTLADVLDAETRTAMPDGSAAAGVHLDMYQINCNLDMNVVRHSRYKLLIEKCHQFDPAKLAQGTRVSFGKMWARTAAVPGVTSPHYLSGSLPSTSVSWPEAGRFRHYRTYRDLHALEFRGITDDSMQRYVERLRAAVIQYDK